MCTKRSHTFCKETKQKTLHNHVWWLVMEEEMGMEDR